MTAENCIKTRRSIRKFKNKKVSNDTIKEIIDLTRFAPSWKNSQTVRFTAITDEKVKTLIADKCTMGFEHNKGIINNAPALMVLTTVNLRSGYERDGSFTTSKGTHWQSFDAGIAAENFCLSAHIKGLGSVIMGIFDEKEVIRSLNIPETESVSALIAFGYPDESPDCPKKKEVDDLLKII